MTGLFMKMNAKISPCGLYRYNLSRQWGSGPVCTFVMLNPSTADADQDDPTIRRCLAFARREKCESLLVVNLFAFRATNPKNLSLALDPVGPENDGEIKKAFNLARENDWPIIAAWGSNKFADERAKRVAQWGPLSCLGVTKHGHPRHPLYLHAESRLSEFSYNARWATT